MLVNLCDYKQSVTLIANSGVQFLDFGLTPQDTASNAELMAQQISGVAALAGNTDQLSAQVAEAAGNLSSTARALDDATHQFVARITAG